MALRVWFCPSRIRREPVGAAALGQYRGFHHGLEAVCAGCWCQPAFLPPYSPELQPCERLWPLSNETIANCRFETLDELQEAQAERCVALQNNATCIRHATLFH